MICQELDGDNFYQEAEGRGKKMTVSYFEEVDAKTHRDIDVKQRAEGLVVSEWKSSPSGVDWEMIRSMRKITQRKEDSV